VGILWAVAFAILRESTANAQSVPFRQTLAYAGRQGEGRRGKPEWQNSQGMENETPPVR
jgi:hypothetical protein